MSTPSTPPHNGAPASSASPFPTGEAQVGVVAKPAARADDGPEPVVEHRIAVPEPEPAATPAPRAEPAAAPAAPAPAPVAAAVPQAAAPAALQESAPVPIPERMNQLNAENKRLRDEMQSLEKAFKKSLN